MTIEWQGNPLIVLFNFSKSELTFLCGKRKGIARQRAQAPNQFPTFQLAVLRRYLKYDRIDSTPDT